MNRIIEKKIYLNNQYNRWQKSVHHDKKIYYKGKIFIKNVLQDFDKISETIIKNIEKKNDLKIKDFLNELNGCFCLIIDHPKFIFATVDHIRSIPLFYYKTIKRFIVSDDANYIREKLKPKLNEINKKEFLLTGFVSGKETLFKNTYQLQAGEYLIYNNENRMKKECFFRFHYKKISKWTKEETIQKLDKTLISVFSRLIKNNSDCGKKFVIPLSGGLDSRLIAFILKRLNIDNVLCYTYGRKNDIDVKISKKVAESLDYEWCFVKYKKKMLMDEYHSSWFRKYLKYASNLNSLPVIQDCFCIKKLKNDNIIDKKSVIIPGYTGDMISGGHIPINNSIKPVDYIYKKHYSSCFNSRENEQIYKDRIYNYLKSISAKKALSKINMIEIFDFYERQAKYITNAIRCYEFFDYNWELPFWDKELIDFFLKIPTSYRLKQKIYKEYCYIFFDKEFSELNNIKCTTQFNPHFKDNAFFLKNIIYSTLMLSNRYHPVLKSTLPFYFLNLPERLRRKLFNLYAEIKNIEYLKTNNQFIPKNIIGILNYFYLQQMMLV